MCYLCMCKRTCVSLCATCVCWCWQSRGWWELNLVLVGVVSSFNWNHSSSCCVLLDLFYFWFLCVALAVPECTLQTRLALNSYLLLSGRGGEFAHTPPEATLYLSGAAGISSCKHLTLQTPDMSAGHRTQALYKSSMCS